MRWRALLLNARRRTEALGETKELRYATEHPDLGGFPVETGRSAAIRRPPSRHFWKLMASQARRIMTFE
jgi:hypothetical protein